jgi:hypothetical protein
MRQTVPCFRFSADPLDSTMRIVDMRGISVSLQRDIANALVNFAEHTVSLVAVVSDGIRHGRPVVGLAFNSIGRFAQGGSMRERFFRGVLGAATGELLAADGASFDPSAVYRVAMRMVTPCSGVKGAAWQRCP